MDQLIISSPLGAIHLKADQEALYVLEFTDSSLSESITNNPILKLAQKELNEYFKGIRKEFTVPVHLEGTSFQQQVWQELQDIPYGVTISYGELARRIGNPAASRAVGGANGKNPISIIVPCHRVISSDRKLGGYSSGLPRKVFLLNLEGADYKE
ncbi:MAG: methylated-DNA--[protein]-cysteine S-methyltransferase [Clostridium sp.]|nr:methylated-DNA--[protein]-cysteine S-methyltransferase [Clostridium sp.]